MTTLKEKLSPYLADFDQLVSVCESEISTGGGRGNRIIEIDNGSELRFTVSPDRAMDIVNASFRGVPLVFRTPSGYRSRMEYDPAGIGWLRTWQGGLMTTCGLRSAGSPDESSGLHGRIGNQPAEDVGVTRTWSEDGSEYRVQVRGVIREACLFGENLRLERTISTAYGKNEICVHDRVINLGPDDDFVQIVYHCNFGYPFVSPAIRFVLPEHRIIPRDENAAADLANWMRMPEPQENMPPEECFFHELPADENGWASFVMENDDVKIRAAVAYDTATLPRVCQWKLFQKNRYVLGVEPTNTTLNGRLKEIADGVAVPLKDGESMDFRIRFSFETMS